MQAAIQAEIPGVEVVKNQIPYEWKSFPKFKGKIGQTTGSRLEIYPNVGAFEVWHENVLLFSKLSCRQWPNFKAVATKVKAYLADKANKVAEMGKYDIKYEHPAKLPAGI